MSFRRCSKIIYLLAGLVIGISHGDEDHNIHAIFKIQTASFDTVTNKFSIEWELDTTDLPAGCEGQIVLFHGTLPSNPPKNNTFLITAFNGDSVFEVKPIIFDAICKIGVWLKIGKDWYAPDTGTLYEIDMPKALWEPVYLFSGSVDDTISIFSNQVLLWRDNSYGNNPLHFDTAWRYTPSESKLKKRGFSASGVGFQFEKADAENPLPSFYIGFRSDSILKNNIPYRIFRDSANSIIAEHDVVYDTVKNLIYVKTDRITLPFLLLRDMISPEIEITSDTGIAVTSKPVDLKFKIRDNVSNCKWSIYRGTAEQIPLIKEPSFSGTLYDTSGIISCKVSTDGTMENGLRLYLVMNDGTRVNTINLSHKARRLKCNEMTTPAEMIMPIAPNAHLDSISCNYALRSLFKEAGGNYSADNFRVYRWQYPSGEQKGKGWVEYSDNDVDLFSFLPGNLFWLITRKEAIIDFGAGYSVSLKDTLTIDLPSEEWTDFSSPYSFPVAFSDILGVSDTASKYMQCYRWVKDETHRTWRADPLYCGGVEGLDSADTKLSYGMNGFFTVYNPSESSTYLRIPPVAVSSATALAKKGEPSNKSNVWSIRFDLIKGESAIGCALCATSENINFPCSVPPAPSFSTTSITVGLSNQQQACGTLVLPAHSDSVGFNVTITNTDVVSATITCSPKLIAGKITGYTTIGTTVQPIFDPFSVTIEPNASRTVTCRTGRLSDEWQGLPTGLSEIGIVSLSSIKGGRILLVRFSSPASKNRIEIFDIAGRRRGVSECFSKRGSGESTALVSLSGTIQSCCLIRMTSFDKDGSTLRTVKKMVVVP